MLSMLSAKAVGVWTVEPLNEVITMTTPHLSSVRRIHEAAGCRVYRRCAMIYLCPVDDKETTIDEQWQLALSLMQTHVPAQNMDD